MVDVQVADPVEIFEQTCTKIQREFADKITQHASMDEIRILLASGAKINDSVVQGLKPLHYAVYGNNMEVVKLLLVRGSDINAVDDVGYSAMHLCAEHGNFAMIDYLINHHARVSFVDTNEKDQFPIGFKCEEPLRMAIKNNHTTCAELLLQNGADPNARYFLGPELTLIPITDIESISLLLMYGANPNVYNRDGLTPLMQAAKHPLGMETVQLLLDYGANINALALERQDFRTPLHYAILSANPEMVQFLIDNGAEVNMTLDYEKPTPLDLGVVRDNLEIVLCLLENGADPNRHHTYIGTSLHLACCSVLSNQYEIIQALLEFGANPNSCPVFDAGPIRSPIIEYFRAGRPEFEVKLMQLLLAYGGEVVMQGPLRNPQGILRAITRLKEKDEAMWDLLIDAADNFDRRYIDRLSLPEPFRRELIERAENPSTLKQQCRLSVRKTLSPLRPSKVSELDLPQTVAKYLIFFHQKP